MPNTAQIIDSGPNKVICLNGWFGHARGWGPLMHSLDTQHFSYAFMDYRGYGARKGIIDLTTVNRLTGVWLNAIVKSSLAHSDVEAFAAYLTAWACTSMVERVQGNPLPVLVVAGEHDPGLGPETCKATWLQHYPNARLEVMTNAGHYPMDETPVALATVTERFLREALEA